MTPDAETPEAFYAQHVACGPSHVVLAILVVDGSPEQYGVFSTLPLAHAWADSVECDDDKASSAIFSPYVIDVPEFGDKRTAQ